LDKSIFSASIRPASRTLKNCLFDDGFHRRDLGPLPCNFKQSFMLNEVSPDLFLRFLQFSPTNYHSAIDTHPSISAPSSVRQPWPRTALPYPASKVRGFICDPETDWSRSRGNKDKHTEYFIISWTVNLTIQYNFLMWSAVSIPKTLNPTFRGLSKSSLSWTDVTKTVLNSTQS
jgi:hypothetical protein